MLEVARKRRNFSPEFRAEIVGLVLDGGRSVVDVCKDHELVESSVYAWVRQAKIDRGKGPEGALTTDEREELRQLRKQNRELTRERDFLQSAAAYFARNEKKGSR